jgi:hypothetical protein
MTLPISVTERLRLLRREIEEILLADKLAPLRAPGVKSDRDRRQQRLQEIKEEIAAMTEWKRP